MIGAVTIIPALLFCCVAFLHGAQRAFVWIGLPCLLFLPNYYTWKISGVPRFDFHAYMLLAALVGIYISGRGVRPKFHAIDLIVVLLIFLMTISEQTNKEFHEARNLLALSVMGLLAPYMIGKTLARDVRSTTACVSCIVLLAALIGMSAPYEARLGSNPYDFLRGMWPTSVPWDGALYRAGIRRVAGPFAHPICHGFFFSLVFPMSVWLVRTHLSSGLALRCMLCLGPLLGLLLSVSRGPYVGTLISLWIMGIGWSKRRGLWLTGTGLAMIVVGIFSFDTISDYVTVDRGEAVTDTQETAAYRNEMLANYLEVVEERPWLGFGKDQIPIIKGQKSIDNQYLFLALTHGLPASFAFLALLLLPAACTFFQIRKAPRDSALIKLRWVLLAVLCGAVLTQITVFSGTQTTQVLFLIQGLTVGLLSRESTRERT